MLHNRVKETSETGGTGNLTLDGAITNYRTFNTAFGTDRRFYYWIVDDVDTQWETGIGYLSTSTTLVRDTIISNSSGTQTALDFSTNAKDIFCEQNYTGAYSSVDVNDDALNRCVFDIDNTEQNSTSSVTNNSNVHYYEFLLTIGGWYSGMIAEVTVGQASSTARMGLYSLVHGRPDKKLRETGSIDTSTTGKKSESFTGGDIHLNCGWWAVAIICTNNTVDFRGFQQDGGRGGPFGQDNSAFSHANKGFYHTGTGIVLPATATSTGTFQRTIITLGLIHA
jgi:hypothetical protein